MSNVRRAGNSDMTCRIKFDGKVLNRKNLSFRRSEKTLVSVVAGIPEKRWPGAKM